MTIAFFALVAVLLVVIWSIRRHRDPKLRIDCSSPIEDCVPTLAGLTLSSVVAGNAVQVLENGEFYDVLI